MSFLTVRLYRSFNRSAILKLKTKNQILKKSAPYNMGRKIPRYHPCSYHALLRDTRFLPLTQGNAALISCCVCVLHAAKYPVPDPQNAERITQNAFRRGAPALKFPCGQTCGRLQPSASALSNVRSPQVLTRHQSLYTAYYHCKAVLSMLFCLYCCRSNVPL